MTIGGVDTNRSLSIHLFAPRAGPRTKIPKHTNPINDIIFHPFLHHYFYLYMVTTYFTDVSIHYALILRRYQKHFRQCCLRFFEITDQPVGRRLSRGGGGILQFGPARCNVHKLCH